LLRRLTDAYPDAVELIGIDPAPRMIAEAKAASAGPLRLRFMTGVAERSPSAEGTFDLIVTTTSLEAGSTVRGCRWTPLSRSCYVTVVGCSTPTCLIYFWTVLMTYWRSPGDLPDPPQRVPVRILIVCGECLVVDGLMRLINRRGEMQVVGTASSVADALESVESLRPDVLLSDDLSGDGDMATLTERVVAQFPETKVLVLAGGATPDTALRSISAGCSGVVAKTATVDDVVRALSQVHRGEVPIPSTLLPELVSGLRRSGRRIGDEITPREREVLGHLASGLSLPDISAAMFISINTTRNHTQRVIEKLGAHSKLEAVVIAMREGLEMTPHRPSTAAVGADLALPSPDGNPSWGDSQIGEPNSTWPR
jgi:DNA-binding NarL/FixJ family response regulator